MSVARSLLVVLAAGLLAAPAAAQRPQYRVLRGLLKFQGVQPEEFPPQPGDRTDDFVLVMIGRIDPGQGWDTVARRVAAGGGAVLLAPDIVGDNGPDRILARARGQADLTDYLPAVPGLGRRCLVGGAVECRRPDHCFAGRPATPIAEYGEFPAPGGAGGLAAAALRGQAPRVAADAPAVLSLGPGRHLLANSFLRFPAGSVGPLAFPVDGLPLLALNTPDPAGVPGTVAVLSAPRLLSDGMMAATDPQGRLAADNFAFAFVFTGYLANTQAAKRTRCIFVENGRAVTNFDEVQLLAVPPGATPPVPDIPLWKLQQKLVELADRKLDDWQANDGPTRAALGRNRERWPFAVRTILIIGAAVLAVLLLRLGWAARVPADRPPVPPPDPAADDGVLFQRRHALLRADNLAEPVREHLRYLFATWGARPAGEHPPVPEVLADGRAGGRLAARVAELWEIAYGPPAGPIGVGRWRDIEAMIDQVARGAADGRWRFADGRPA
jgi:hypothetical protein